MGKEPGTHFAVEVNGGLKAQGGGQTIGGISGDTIRNLAKRVGHH